VVIRRQADGIVREQTHLSEETSQRLLRTLRPKIVLTGHDHNGCFWNHTGGVPEYTVRSAMGDFGGSAKLLAIQKADGGAFKYVITDCNLGLRMRDLLTAAIVAALWLLSILTSLLIRCCCCCCCRRRRSSSIKKAPKTKAKTTTAKDDKKKKDKKEKEKDIAPVKQVKKKQKTN
jgi:hypothetical protein